MAKVINDYYIIKYYKEGGSSTKEVTLEDLLKDEITSNGMTFKNTKKVFVKNRTEYVVFEEV